MSVRLERQLDELLASTSEIAVNQIIGSAKVKVSDITHDSSKVSNGVIFCCIVGENVDGHNFAKVAAANGAIAILVERRVEVDVTQVVVSDVRLTMGYLAAELFNRPSEKLHVIGITGTNGKTTTWLRYCDSTAGRHRSLALSLACGRLQSQQICSDFWPKK
jgi:UDP-N-acetylmuramoyl-L-alanyl-D-glutamate--2,6-diaminopimelate ligase